MTDRRSVPGWGVRDRLGSALPAMFHDEEFIQRWCDGLDEALAPVPATLDCLWAYLDPMLAPDDFVDWLAGWVGVELDREWDGDRRRALVANAHRVFDARGTIAGLADLVESTAAAWDGVSDPVRPLF